VERGLKRDQQQLGKHKRACLYQGVPHYESLIALESSGELIERLPNIRDEQGQLQVLGKSARNYHVKMDVEPATLVSTTDTIRFRLREIVRQYLHERVKLSELEYQPRG
jgi:hypothetical protein